MSSEPDADVLVLGASFAGLGVVRRLLRMRPRVAVRIVVVDRQPRQIYLPLVHEVVAGRIAAERACLLPAAHLSRFAAVRFVPGTVTGLDPDSGMARLEDGRRLRAPIVVVALGSALAPPPSASGVRRAAVTYKTYADAMAARGRVANLLGRSGARITVVGGGLSGVELAAELAYAGRERGLVVDLFSAGETLLATFPAHVRARAARILETLGVQVHTSSPVVEATHGHVVSQTGGSVCRTPADAIFWAAGVRPAPVLSQLNLPRTPRGFLRVPPTLCAFRGRGRATVFVCGDAAEVVEGDDDAPWPTMRRAVECLWQARVAAHNVAATFLAGTAATPMRHRLRTDFPYGISLGPRSLVVHRGAMLDVPPVGIALRRLLMRLYQRRFRP